MWSSTAIPANNTVLCTALLSTALRIWAQKKQDIDTTIIFNNIRQKNNNFKQPKLLNTDRTTQMRSPLRSWEVQSGTCWC